MSVFRTVVAAGESGTERSEGAFFKRRHVGFVVPFEVPILLKCLLYRSTRCNSVLDDIGHTNGRDLRTRTALPDVM